MVNGNKNGLIIVNFDLAQSHLEMILQWVLHIKLQMDIKILAIFNYSLQALSSTDYGIDYGNNNWLVKRINKDSLNVLRYKGDFM